MELNIGTLFHDRYRLTQIIGQGASAQVWKAMDTKANNLVVALKIFHALFSGTDSHGFMDFEREFTQVYNLKQTYLLTPTGYDICNGVPYLVLQYCENGSVSSMVGQTDQDTLIDFLHDVACGLEYLHDHDIVHRDIKPDNIMVDDNIHFMVTDFGISVQNIGHDKGAMGSSGSPAYMAPEIYTNGDAVKASDIWALGATAYELVEKQLPFGMNGGLSQASGEQMREMTVKIHPELKRLITRCLDKDPWNRPRATEIRTMLEQYRQTGRWHKISRKRIITYAAIALAFLGVFAALYLWDYYRVKTAYYKDYVEEWGVPQGIHKLSKNDMEQRVNSYRFVYHKHKLIRMSYVNSRDKVVGHHDSDDTDLNRPDDIEFFYNRSGDLDYAKVYDCYGKILYLMDYSDNMKVMTFRYDDESGTEKPLSTSSTFTASTEEQTSKSRIVKYLLTYDEEGRTTQLMYASTQNTITGDDNLIFGRKFEYDDEGRLKQETYLGYDSKPKAKSGGLAIRKWEYNDEDDIVKTYYLTAEGKPSGESGLGTTVCHNIRDEYGNLICQRSEDLDGNLTIRQDLGISSAHDVVKDGLTTKVYYTGLNDQRVYEKESKVGGYTITYDENGFTNKLEYIDIHDKPMQDNTGVFITKMQNDDKGNRLKIEYCDKEGKPIENTSGIATITCKYDSVGNLLEASYFDKEGKLCTIKGDNYAIIAKTYDKFGRELSEKYFGKDKEPVKDENGVSCYKYEYNPNGSLRKATYHDEKDSLTQNTEGVACIERTYNENGLLTNEYYYNTDGKRTMSDGYSGIIMTYDEAGQCIDYRYVNNEDKATQVPSKGYAGIRYEHDKHGNVIHETRYGPDGKLARNYLDSRHVYDSDDNEIEESLYDANGNRAANSNGVSIIRYKYNSRRMIVEYAYFDKNENPTKAKEGGYSIHRCSYNDKGELVKESFYDTEGKPIIRTDEPYSMRKNEYNIQGQIIKQSYFDVDGNPTDPKKFVPVGVCEYDDNGNMIMVGAQDADNHFIYNPKTGCSITRYEYNEKQQIVSQKYYDTNDKPTLNTSNGCFEERMKYDEFGNQIEVAYYGLNGKLTNGKLQYARIRQTYRSDGETPNTLEFFDSSGRSLLKARWVNGNWQV